MGSQPGRPFVLSQLSLSCREDDESDDGMGRGETPGAVQQISWHLP